MNILQVYQYDKKIRLGEKADGGYVIGELDDGYDCYISCGVATEESFSRDFINFFKMSKDNCYAFDGTIEKYPDGYTDNIQFIRKNIATFTDITHSNLRYFTNTYNNIFLKMDIEGGEYPWLSFVTEQALTKFKQIVIELHGLTGDGWGTRYKDKLPCLEKLAKTHYIIHAHGNNYSPVVNNIPDVIELTYINKNCFKVVPEKNKLRLPNQYLDFPNNPEKPDIDLNVSPFVNN